MFRFHFFLPLFFLICMSGFSQEDENKSSASARVQLLDTTFIISEINNYPHKIWIYLPKNYSSSKNSYPVIYMHDGQNLFDKKTSYAGEWEVDEALDSIFDETGKGFVVVGIENAGKERINEYTPWKNEKYGGGSGSQYMEFIVSELKPYIDAHFRTKKDAKNTALIGSSLGGLISFYGGFKYPKVFGKIAALSTSFWFSNEVHTFIKNHSINTTVRLYMIVGKKEGYGMDASNQKAYDWLLASGFNKTQLFFKIDSEGAHNEAFWRRIFPHSIKWLFNF